MVASFLVYEVYRASIWSGLLGCLMGVGFIAYGAKRTAHPFNPFNLWQKPLPVWAARVIYYPIGLVFVFLGIRDLIRILK